MKLWNKFSWFLIFTLLCTMIPTINIKANTIETEEDGIKIGSVIYDYDENGNITEIVVDGEGGITEEQAFLEYYSKFYGNGDEPSTEQDHSKTMIITENTTLKDVTLEKNIYIAEEVTLTIESSVTINGNIYVFGTLNNAGNLTVTGSLYCLNYEDQKVGEYENGVFTNQENSQITCDNILVTDEYVEDGIPMIYNLISIDENGKETVIESFNMYNDALNAYETIIKENENINYAVKSQDTYWIVKYAVVSFKKIVSNGTVRNVNYKEDGTNTSGYLNPSYSIDAAYLETKDGKVKFRIANVTAWCDASLVDIIPYSENTLFINYYKVSDNKLYHHIRRNSVKKSDESGSYYGAGLIGPAPKYLSSSEFYYSYDAKYFYTDYFKMIDDYRNNTNVNAVNKDEPHYNYYQYLSHRTTTVYTVEQINKYLNYFIDSSYRESTAQTSKMRDSGELFVSNQNLYGSNALLMIGVAANESAWGTSSMAMSKNNLFGHAAYDSSPDSSSGYETVDESIRYHAQIYISRNYASPTIWENGKVVLGSTYFSANLGDKGSGMNIRYASDPYWGEKNARFAYQINEYYDNEDYGRYTIGVKNVVDAINIRKEPTSQSTKLYVTENILDVPFIIYEAVKGESVNDNDVWYKIQSDAPLLEDRSSYTTTNDTYVYDYVNSYAYVHSSYVDIVFEGKEKIEYPEIENPTPDPKPEPEPEPEPDPKPEPEPDPEPPVVDYDIQDYLTKAGIVLNDGYIMSTKSETTISSTIESLSKIDSTVKVEIDTNGHTNSNDYVSTDMILKISTPDNKVYTYTFVVKGDVNCDGKISSVDYVMVKNHILEISLIQSTKSKAADVNMDGQIRSVDYVMIKNHILKISEIK